MTAIARTVPLLLLLLGLLAPTTGMASPSASERSELERVRAVYFEAVRDERAIGRGMELIRTLRERRRPAAGSGLDELLRAYQGALVTLRAKHALWPGSKLRHLRDGLALLDASVDAQPGHVEIRFLRLMSCYYLPGLLGRGASVQEDFRALSELLPGAGDAYPPELYADMVGFVLEWKRLPPERRDPLAAALARANE